MNYCKCVKIDNSLKIIDIIRKAKKKWLIQNKTRAFCDKNHKKIKENNAIAIKMTKSFKATGVFLRYSS